MRVRMIPFARLLKHGKMIFTKDEELTDLLPKYPGGLNEAERRLAESSVRAAFGAVLPSLKHLDACDWPKRFWRHNYDWRFADRYRADPTRAMSTPMQRRSTCWRPD